jgi:hypothetical protein
MAIIMILLEDIKWIDLTMDHLNSIIYYNQFIVTYFEQQENTNFRSWLLDLDSFSFRLLKDWETL